MSLIFICFNFVLILIFLLILFLFCFYLINWLVVTRILNYIV